ncbi:putative F-box/LRR-repeat/kelch-repeat protein [Cucumis melo var. makuwa]|uniref:F-box/LRR-repeat/kelch-repeat protein n=1 Tax=Cucumis melo var. makuwa TaxID=1194695 RepID=A0A5D3DNJ1_CUCMM|nr:putative F-box/LRR-repeat/kelch-repeat protein [Cucumis melo var. makuwa]TYK25092.1 putative F-box/LRR-repeat/kelch-repeat protein [Cucumis melo var. makuwa]
MIVVSDVVIHILSKLSPESLLRFNSVCKSWYALINDPKFVTKHLLDSFPHKHVLLKRIITNNSGKKEHVFSILEFSLDRSVSSVYDVPLPFHESPRPCLSYPVLPNLDVRGHSHGLICLSDHNRDIFLCNPLTRQFRKLPPTILVVPEPEGPVNLSLGVVGFGYDVKCRDFKVVKLVGIWRGLVRYPARVEIYDLRKDRWREIKTLADVTFLGAPSFDMYHEGTFYWLGIDLPSDEEVILTFDMSKEAFRKISIPESFHSRLEDYTTLMVLDGSLRIFSYLVFKSNDKVFDIWETEMDRVSWSKLLTIGPLFEIKCPLFFLSSNELLMDSEERQMILYDCKTEQIKELQVRSERMFVGDNSTRFAGTNLFVKSLVSVEGGNNMSYEF